MKFKSLIPVYGLFQYFEEGWNEDEEKGISLPIICLKSLGHAIYAAAFGTFLLYSAGLHQKGEINPFEQQKVFNERVKVERLKEDYTRNQDELLQFTAANNSGGINFDKRVDAWRKMRLLERDKVYMEGEVKFPKPSLRDLERGIKNYGAQRR